MEEERENKEIRGYRNKERRENRTGIRRILTGREKEGEYEVKDRSRKVKMEDGDGDEGEEMSCRVVLSKAGAKGRERGTGER